MATQFAKSAAKKLLHKLADSIDIKDDLTNNLIIQNSSGSDDKPPATPPKPYSGYTGQSASQPALTSAFSNLSVSGGSAPPEPHFVGGFNPAYPAPYASGLTPGNDPSQRPSSTPNLPISMPSPISSNSGSFPQSLTMQMALQGHDDIRPNLGPSPVSTPSKPSSSSSKPPRPSLPSQTTSSSSGSKADSGTPTKPKPAKKPRPSKTKVDDDSDYFDEESTPPKAKPAKKPRPSKAKADDDDSDSDAGDDSPSSPTPDQCAGVTKAGKRCTRKVKGGPALAAYDFDNSETNLAKFCHQHSKELMGPSGYYARKNGEWVDFETWIPGYLQPETQVALRVEMEKSRSQSDVPGYIYTFEIREPTERETVKLKVGRAVNLVKRIDQWGKQCGSKEQVLRGFYPGSVEPDEDGGEGSLMKGRVKAGEKGPWCHRLERLIHLHLADLVSTAVYLHPQWPNINGDDVPKVDSGSQKLNNGPCADCGSMHKEIFEFQRWTRGRNQGKEWELVVKPVIERWGRFVELYV
ncbi:hypothetical protein CVT24_011426 [Panaeolus cyanescens]|uniref:DUF1766-domain-containing protein n=1 Tax=Panaeolus cyanescens TaxID=181874 RepID=A0A409YGQ7_9AGAR|nr:hypothetical protein CVT24_011426 [Panaeolus cyanescens]